MNAKERYLSFKNRPDGLPFATTNENGEVKVYTVEVFCRANEANVGQPPRMCRTESKFSHTGNLRVHLKAVHELRLPKLKAGAPARADIIEVERKEYKFSLKNITIQSTEYLS
ncbi:hypothetical protein L228DRAFT_115620 [Xylona heveae TC161]|uniref:Uncharacterized protein n=1 Tax=Xylona heveae (strain CBS 132557 / TC161) TaxID=1328760 RepID=A0A165HEX5_XYLHT|nr:hypothetical protein L228DRAFT_115620 [Xylona heveae TC161]KZF23409.1 hypothetical protein L228DRAFT_115620 [Xylona heveae TC161]